MKNKYALVASVTVLLLSGCANMNYSNKLTSVSDGLYSGNVKASLASLDSFNDAKNNTEIDLLYKFEQGELRRLDGNISGSTESWLQADGVVRAWEDNVRMSAGSLLEGAGSLVFNDTVRKYEGRDYEKVMLNLGLALNHLTLNDWDSARIEIKKMHERQALIAEYQSKKLEQAKADAEEKQLKVTSFKELGGYPIETLEAPEVASLKNSYESAFGHYLAGFVYEALGEPSMAAPGYRKAAEMVPNNPLIEEGLKGLDARSRPAVPAVAPPAAAKVVTTKTGKGGKGSQKTVMEPAQPVQPPALPLVDTLIVVEGGLAPKIDSQQIAIPVPIPCRSGYCIELAALSWPVVRPVSNTYPSKIVINNTDLSLTSLTNVNAMSRRALYDEMPAIITRTAIRAIVKISAQKATDEVAARAGAVGSLISVATKLAVAATEVADERTWRTLPDSFLVARTRLTPGTHTLQIDVGGIPKTVQIDVKGKYAVATLRLIGNQLYQITPRAEPVATVAVDVPKQ